MRQGSWNEKESYLRWQLGGQEMRLWVVCWNNRCYNHHETASASGMTLTLKNIRLLKTRRNGMTLHGLI